MIYFDNAATSWPKPESVYQTMDSFLREKGANPGRAGHDMAVAAESVIEETRTLVARLINAPDPKDIAFTLNCTDSLNLALKGFLRPGDHVVTDAIGHNSLVRPLSRLERDGVRITAVAPMSNAGAVSPADIEAAVEPNTKLIAITHASNVSGAIQPMAEIGEVARRRGLTFVVDAAQTAGVLPIDVQAANIDLLALSGHKGPLGPPGTGALYIHKRIDLEQTREGGTGTRSESLEQPVERPQRYESGTPNTVGIAGLGAGLRFVLGEGVDRIRAHEVRLTQALLAGLAPITGVTLYGPPTAEGRTGVVSFRIDGWNPGEAGAVLDQAFDIKVRTGLHCAPAAHRELGTLPYGTIRAAVGYFNTLDEAEAFADAVRRIAASPPATVAAPAVLHSK